MQYLEIPGHGSENSELVSLSRDRKHMVLNVSKKIGVAFETPSRVICVVMSLNARFRGIGLSESIG